MEAQKFQREKTIVSVGRHKLWATYIEVDSNINIDDISILPW